MNLVEIAWRFCYLREKSGNFSPFRSELDCYLIRYMVYRAYVSTRLIDLSERSDFLRRYMSNARKYFITRNLSLPFRIVWNRCKNRCEM